MSNRHLVVSRMDSGSVNWTRLSIPCRISSRRCCRCCGVKLSWMRHHPWMHSDDTVNASSGRQDRIVAGLLLLLNQVMLLKRSQQGHRLHRAQCPTSSRPAWLHSTTTNNNQKRKFLFFQVQLLIR
jgi:hypothetical protein